MNGMCISVSCSGNERERESERERHRWRAHRCTSVACSVEAALFGTHFAAGKLFAPICPTTKMCNKQQHKITTKHKQQQQQITGLQRLTDRLVAMVKVAIEAAEANTP